MPYVGNPLADAYSARQKQDLTGQSGTSFTLTHAVSSPNDLSVYINHVRQEPTTAYTVNGTALETTGTVAGTDDFYIIYDELAIQSISHPTNQALTATAGTFTSGLVGTTATFSGALSATTGTFSGAVDIQGQELILDADNDTSITADTDDQIDLKVGGTDTIVVKPDVVEIKGSHPDLKLMDTDDNNYGGLFYNNGSITLATDHDATGATGIIKFAIDGSEKGRIEASGNVGINTTSPDAKLDVEGSTDAEARITRSAATTSGTFNDAGSVLNLVNNVNYENGYNGGASIGQILFTSNDTSTGAGVRAKISCKATTYYHAERLQFFVSPPNTTTGQVSATSNTDGLRMEINDDGTVKIGSDIQPAAWGLRVSNNSGNATIQARNHNGGNMLWQGLNLNGSQSSTISESGVGYFANGVSSDETLKNVKGVMNDGWSKLKDIQPKSFTWKKITFETNKEGEEVEVKSDDDLDGNIHYGVMAQDLKKIIPDLAYGEEGGMSVDYNGLLMVAINTIKELEARITALENK